MITNIKGRNYYYLGYTDTSQTYMLYMDINQRKYAAKQTTCGLYFMTPVDPSTVALSDVQPIISLEELQKIL